MPDISSTTSRHPAADDFARLLRGFSTQLKKAARAPDAESIHDLRVAIRRLDQALVAFGGWFDAGTVTLMRRHLKTVLTSAGAVRDYDIAIELLDQAGQPADGEMAGHIRARRKGAERRLVSTLHRAARSELPKMLHASGLDHLSWDAVARKEVLAHARNFFRSGCRANKKGSPADLHKLRISAKKFRYTFELFQAAFGPTAESRLNELRQVQRALGEINDLRTVRALVDELGGRKKLDAALRKQQRKKVAKFHRIWKNSFSQSEHKEWMRSLRHPLRKPVGQAILPAAGFQPAQASPHTRSAG